MAYRLRKRESLADGLRRIAAQQCGRAVAALDGSPTDEQVHEARVRIKRVRAILAMLRGSMGRPARSESDALGEVARSLAGPRDAVSLCEAFASLRERFGAFEPETFERVGCELARRATAARARGIGSASLQLARHALQQAAGRASDWTIEGEGFDVIREGLRRTYARARRDRRDALASHDPAVRHAWRTQVRRLGEQVRVISAFWPEVLRPHAKLLRDIASHLGTDHDLSLLAALLRAEADAFGGQDTAHAIAHLAEQSAVELARSCRRPARQALAERPSAALTRLETLWRAWRK